MIHHIEDEKILMEVINNDKLVIIDFFAEWCGPCQMLTPVLKALDEKYSGEIEVYKVNVDESQNAAMRYGVTAMPTLIFFKDGEEVERQIGYMDEEELDNLIKEFIN
ncbi:MAG: thioredoxin [Clostridia bacterium]|nr:thioredoxin [Clostridia bacterium]